MTARAPACSRLELDPASRDPVWLDIAPRYRDARCKADAAADGCGLRWRFQRVEAAKKIPAGAASPAAAGTQPALATPSAGGTGAAAAPDVTAQWTYGRHAVLRQSAHVTIGAEAIGFACIEGDGGGTVSYRMTPGLVPAVKQPDTSVFGIFLKPFQISGGGQFSPNSAGFVEQNKITARAPSRAIAAQILSSWSMGRSSVSPLTVPVSSWKSSRMAGILRSVGKRRSGRSSEASRFH